jgi:Na+:H+ antiporter, NhaA family
MTQHALSHGAIGSPTAKSRRRHPYSIVRFAMDRFLLLPLGAVIALVWANVAGESYFPFAHALAFPVNEIGMALFLALITQEVIEELMPGGALHTWRRWSLAVAGAVGGAAGAASVYLAYVRVRHEDVLMSAWPVAVAIDVAAGYYLLKMIFRRSNVLSLVLLLGIITDAVGLIVLAAWTPITERHLIGAGLLVGAMVIAAWLRHSRVKAFWPYLGVCGAISWWGFWAADVHPALALVPIVPFLPREPRAREPFADPADDDPIHHSEHEWNEAVQVVVFLFGLVNAGVVLRGYDTGTWAVLWAALIGRPVGILAAIALAVAAGLHLPRGMGWRQLVVAACATSSGFTLPLFFASGLLPVGAVLQQIKVGALATVAGALLAVAAAWLLHVGRFRRVHGGNHHVVRVHVRPVA